MTALPALAPAGASPWLAELQLGFARVGGRSVLRHNRHRGPLRVQKALYPEGDAVCQAMLLHPPSGLAGGDQLTIQVELETDAMAQLTTPGAGKWYRSGGAHASQHLDFQVGPGATLEWLPQESILFRGARADMTCHIQLAADSRYLGWDLLCLGRTAAGERFDQGSFATRCRIERAGVPLWLERGGAAGEDALLHSPAGWAGCSVSGTLLCCFPELPQQAAALLEALRPLAPQDGARHGLTVLPGVLIARYLGDSSEAARHWFTALWQLLRPVFCGRPAVIPRIWHT